MASFTRLPSGKWRVQVRRKGVCKTKSFDTKRAAKEWADITEAGILTVADDGLKPVVHATVADLIEKFLQEVKVKSTSSVYVYTRVSKSSLGAVKLKDLSHDHIDAWVEECLRKAKPNSVRMYCSLMNRVLRWAVSVKRLRVPENLFRDAISRMRFIGHDVTATGRDRVLTEGELQALYAHWRAEPHQYPMVDIVRFAVETCCRINEICRVEARDYRPETKTLWIRDRKNPGSKPKHTELPLSDAAQAVVEARIAAGFTGRLFPHQKNLVSLAFKQACGVCDIDDSTFHDLRHTGATRYALKGLTMAELQLITGHGSILSLSRYVNLRPNDIHRRLAELEAEKRHLQNLMAAE